MSPLLELAERLDPHVSSEELSDADTDVFRCAVGLCVQNEAEIIDRLRLLYWRGFVAGLNHVHQSGTPAGITTH